MTFQNNRSGQANPAEYMASGLPYITQSSATNFPIRIDFPYVTQWIQIKNNSGDQLRYSFTSGGLNTGNYGTLPVSGVFDARLRVKTLFLRANSTAATFEVAAGLTSVLWQNFPTLTGSAVYPSGSNNSAIWEFGYGVSGSAGAGSGLG